MNTKTPLLVTMLRRRALAAMLASPDAYLWKDYESLALTLGMTRKGAEYLFESVTDKPERAGNAKKQTS